MDLAILAADLVDKQLTDIKLIISDNYETIHLYAHKLVLYSSSKFFYKLFKKDSKQSVIKLVVHDASITKELIVSFYGNTIAASNLASSGKNNNKMIKPFQNPATRILETIRCRYHFLLDIDISTLHNIKITDDNTDLFFQVISMFDLSDYKLLAVVQNIILTNNLSNVPNKLSKLVANIEKKYIITCCKKGHVKIYDIDTGSIVKSVYLINDKSNNIIDNVSQWYYDIVAVALSIDRIIIGYEDGSVRMFNLDTGKFTCYLATHTYAEFTSNISIEINENYVISIARGYDVQIHDSGYGTKLFSDIGKIHMCKLSGDKNKLIVSGYNLTYIFDICAGVKICELPYTICQDIAFSTDSNLVAIASDKYVNIHNTVGKIIYKPIISQYKILCIAFSPNNSKLVTIELHHKLHLFSSRTEYQICVLNTYTGAILNTFRYICDSVPSKVLFMNHAIVVIHDSGFKTFNADTGVITANIYVKASINIV